MHTIASGPTILLCPHFVGLDVAGCSVYARQSIKPIIRAMHQRLPYFMCPGMDFGAKDAVFVPFFGVPAATLTAPARLASVTGARLIPVIATTLPRYKGWKVEFHPPGKETTPCF